MVVGLMKFCVAPISQWGYLKQRIYSSFAWYTDVHARSLLSNTILNERHLSHSTVSHRSSGNIDRWLWIWMHWTMKWWDRSDGHHRCFGYTTNNIYKLFKCTWIDSTVEVLFPRRFYGAFDSHIKWMMWPTCQFSVKKTNELKKNEWEANLR